jgi:hypothetical protein
MHPPRSVLEQGPTREFPQGSLVIPDAFFTNAPGNRDMDRFGHIRVRL